MGALARNLRFALRQLRKTPGFSVTVILTLALGIGATTAIFSLVEGILLRPLPFNNSDRLVLLGDHLGNGRGTPVTAREVGVYSTATSAFSSLGGYITVSYELSGGPTPEEIHAARLTATVFPTLGAQPILGRVFSSQEETSHQPLAVISYALWLNRYHRDPNVLGSSVILDRRPYTIIGVMPRSFEFPLQDGRLNQSQLWVPMSLTPEELSDAAAGMWGYQMVGRLKDGVSLQQAEQDTDRVAQQIVRNAPSMSALRIRGGVIPLKETSVAGIRSLLRTLFFAVAIVLLIACVNVAGLLLVRAIRRRREYALRLALGARTSAILRESVIEGLLLSLAGGLLGLAFAATAIRVALHLLPESMPRVDSVSMDAGVVAFALLLALATGALCSLAPAFAAMRTNLIESLKEGIPTGTGASSHSWLRSALVVSEIAIALVLLTLSGAFLRSFQKMHDVDPGYRPEHVLVAGYQLPLNQYPTSASNDAFNRDVIDRLSSQPGVVAAGITTGLPGYGAPGSAYTIEGIPAAKWKLQFAMFASIYGNYFRALQIPLLEGRTFTMEDRANAPLVVIVNQSMAKHSWPGQSPVGRRIHIGNPTKNYPWATVVGIVADTKLGSRDEASDDQFYLPALQPAIISESTAPAINLSSPGGGYITLRSTLPSEQMSETLRSTIAAVDPLLALQQVQPMTDVIANVEAPRRFNTSLITAFALGALLLAITGIYAVVGFSASMRTQEIAIRMALGAQRTSIARLILISGAKLALIGCVLGLLMSFAVSRLVSSFLFDVSATDPLVYLGAVLTMMLMALLASALPASRAASADPIKSLRST